MADFISGWSTPVASNNWTVHYAGHNPQPITLRQWFELLAGIYGENKCTPENQMELLMCMKEQGFEI